MHHPFGPWLRKQLVDAGVSQSDLVQRLSDLGHDITRSAVSLWCSGRALPTADKLSPIFDVLGLNAADRAHGLRIASQPKAENAGRAA